MRSSVDFALRVSTIALHVSTIGPHVSTIAPTHAVAGRESSVDLPACDWIFIGLPIDN